MVTFLAYCEVLIRERCEVYHLSTEISEPSLFRHNFEHAKSITAISNYIPSVISYLTVAIMIMTVFEGILVVFV